MPRSYSSASPPGGEGDTSTEGITFTLDGVTFTCHGRLSAYDLSEFAGPVADGDADAGEPGAMRVLADFLRSLLGEVTYRPFMRHRRAHMTPDSVVQEITGGIIEEAVQRETGRPTPRPSTSPPGPSPTPVSSPATSPSQAWKAAGQQEEDGVIPADVARGGDVTFLPVPAGGLAPGEGTPLARTRRVINLGDGSRTRVEPLAG